MGNFASIPTLYNGVQFRSRLEARWAAFFDLCKWDWEYEPIDLNGWIPEEFGIKGKKDLLVEIKPYDISTLSWEDLCQYLGDENSEISPEWQPTIKKILKAKPESDVLLLGNGIYRYEDGDDNYSFGVVLQDGLESAINIAPMDSSPIVLKQNLFPDYVEGPDVWANKVRAMIMPPQVPIAKITSFWKEAGNKVQWKKSVS